MTKRILAMTLCLALTLLACACVASDVTVSAPESTDSKGGNTPDLSTMEQPGTSTPASQMSSQPAFSDTVSKPTEPILPEERETTLELIASCVIGTEGAFEYGFTFYDDPSTAILEMGGQIYTDGNGNFYQVYRGSLIVCVNNGERLPTLHKGQVLDVVICGNSFYVLTAEGNVYKYDISNGFENCTFAKEHPIFKKHEELAKFGPIVDGRPTVQYYAKEGTVWYPDGPYYTLEKEKLPDSKLQSFYVYVESRQDREPIQVVSDEFKGWAVSEDAYSVLYATSEIIVLRENNTPKGISIFVSYDANGNLLSRHAMYKGEAAKTSCERPFEQGGSHLLKEVLSYSYTIDTTVFDGLVNHLILRDSAGNQYFAAYYLDRCDVYRINPGYSDRDYVTEWQKNEAEDSRIAPTSDASGSSASSVYFLDIKRDEAKANALEMINLDWDIMLGNLTPRPYEDYPNLKLDLPQYLIGDNVSTDQTGIPYCKAGYHGADNFESEAARLLSDGTRQMTGNVSSVTNHQDYTLGLDCARFLCKAFEFSSGLAPWQLKEDYLEVGCGHEVDSITELEEMDVIISASHAMFFKRISPTGIVEVYDVTSTVYYAKTRERSTGYTPDQLIAQGYHFYHVYPGIDYSTTQHWIACDSCGEYPQNYENHTLSYHYNATRHWTYCTDGCGFESTASRPHTLQYGVCTVCGYNQNALNTRPGTEVVLEQ